MTQEQIPVEDVEPDRSICAWCGEPASTTLELEPVSYTHRKGPDGKKVKLVKKHAIVRPVCLRHYKTLQRSEDAA